jgi:hypothetical protein
MATKDLHSRLGLVAALMAASVADNTVQTGATVDLQGFESCTFAVQSGTLADADATFTVKLQHGDLANGSDMADVTAADLIGAAPVFSAATDDNVARKVGYRGTKRYVRVVITPASNAAAAAFSALAILGHARNQPVA